MFNEHLMRAAPYCVSSLVLAAAVLLMPQGFVRSVLLGVGVALNIIAWLIAFGVGRPHV